MLIKGVDGSMIDATAIRNRNRWIAHHTKLGFNVMEAPAFKTNAKQLEVWVASKANVVKKGILTKDLWQANVVN